jgi:predicted metal-dependent HD superfamily phosphohydrolase
VTPELEAAYAEPHRRYHDRRHIERCLALLDELVDLTDGERRVLTWAIWWHDAIYDPAASDNEARSAERAKAALREQGASLHEREEVARLIRLTAGHEVDGEDRLGGLLVSIDLAILAEPPAEYDAYARDVRAEYTHVPDDLWRLGRAQVLQRFLAAPVIFPDLGFRARLEAQARANLARELASLS